jgi:type VI secretion system secreted protein Hcp
MGGGVYQNKIRKEGKTMIKIGYLTITPESSGEAIVGPSVYSMAEDTIEVLAVQHQVRREYDEQHGPVTGDRKHEPLRIIKEVDVTTPTLNAICANGELLSEVKLEYFKQIGNAPAPVKFFTWTLTNAYITHVKCIMAMELGDEYAKQYDLLEEVAFSYQQIAWEHHAHRSPIGLKDLAAVVQGDAWTTTA